MEVEDACWVFKSIWLHSLYIHYGWEWSFLGLWIWGDVFRVFLFSSDCPFTSIPTHLQGDQSQFSVRAKWTDYLLLAWPIAVPIICLLSCCTHIWGPSLKPESQLPYQYLTVNSFSFLSFLFLFLSLLLIIAHNNFELLFPYTTFELYISITFSQVQSHSWACIQTKLSLKKIHEEFPLWHSRNESD